MNITPTRLRELLDAETIRQCGHEERKGQLSMSWLHLPVDVIVDQVRKGCHFDDATKLKLYQGTHAEIGLRTRLSTLFSQDNIASRDSIVWKPPQVIEAYDGKLTGHIDGYIESAGKFNDETLIEFKTVPDLTALAEIRRTRMVPRKVFHQVNAYMLWGDFVNCFVVYETRYEGEHEVLEIHPSHRLQEELKTKVERVLSMLD